jgi:hypothetical protein
MFVVVVMDFHILDQVNLDNIQAQDVLGGIEDQ